MRWDLRQLISCCGWRATRVNRFPSIAGSVLSSSNGNPASNLLPVSCAHREEHDLFHSVVGEVSRDWSSEYQAARTARWTLKRRTNARRIFPISAIRLAFAMNVSEHPRRYQGGRRE